MGNTQDGITNEKEEQQPNFKVLSEVNDIGYGQFKFIRFHDEKDKSKIRILKSITPKGLGELYTFQHLEKRFMTQFPNVSRVIYFKQSKTSPSECKVIFEYSKESLESLLSKRAMTEKELWSLYDFLLEIGIQYETMGEHYYEICSRDILYVDDRMTMLNQYIYDKYVNSIMRHFNDVVDNPEQKKLYNRVLRYNVKRLGAFLIECGLRRTTKLDQKNEEQIKSEAKRMKEFYSARFCQVAQSMALNHDGMVFKDLKKSEFITYIPGSPPKKQTSEILPGPTASAKFNEDPGQGSNNKTQSDYGWMDFGTPPNNSKSRLRLRRKRRIPGYFRLVISGYEPSLLSSRFLRTSKTCPQSAS